MYEIYKNYFGYIFLCLEYDDDIVLHDIMQGLCWTEKINYNTFCSLSLLSFDISLYLDLKISGSMLSFLISINSLACKPCSPLV